MATSTFGVTKRGKRTLIHGNFEYWTRAPAGRCKGVHLHSLGFCFSVICRKLFMYGVWHRVMIRLFCAEWNTTAGVGVPQVDRMPLPFDYPLGLHPLENILRAPMILEIKREVGWADTLAMQQTLDIQIQSTSSHRQSRRFSRRAKSRTHPHIDGTCSESIWWHESKKWHQIFHQGQWCLGFRLRFSWPWLRKVLWSVSFVVIVSWFCSQVFPTNSSTTSIRSISCVLFKALPKDK